MPYLNAVRAHPDAATAVCVCAEDVVKHWHAGGASTQTGIAEHMTRLATSLAQLAMAIEALRAADAADRDDDSAEFAADMDLGRLKLP